VKLDGWRATLAISDGRVVIRSRRHRRLNPYVPELVAAARQLLPDRAVLDGELVIVRGGGVDFGALQQRLQAGPRRAAGLARTAPAVLVAFDLLCCAGVDLRGRPYDQRRAQLAELIGEIGPPFGLIPMTCDPHAARAWLDGSRPGVEGIVAKRRDQSCRGGARSWAKLRYTLSCDVVVGGIAGPLRRPDALILGVPNHAGRLRIAGRTRPLPPAARRELAGLLTAAGATHPWPTRLPSSRLGLLPGELVDYTPTRPDLVVEIATDGAREALRYRHPPRYIRPRLDLRPADLTADPNDQASPHRAG
jgi:ATP-dependent DNA ligase